MKERSLADRRHAAKGGSQAAGVPSFGREGLGTFKSAVTNRTEAMPARVRKIPRHDVTRRISAPIWGAKIGPKPVTSMRVEKNRAAIAPSKRSRTMARAITIPAAPPRPCKKRSPSKRYTLDTKVQASDESTNAPMPTSSGPLLPSRSLIGPITELTDRDADQASGDRQLDSRRTRMKVPTDTRQRREIHVYAQRSEDGQSTDDENSSAILVAHAIGPPCPSDGVGAEFDDGLSPSPSSRSGPEGELDRKCVGVRKKLPPADVALHFDLGAVGQARRLGGA